MNKKGLAEGGLTFILVAILSTIGATGTLFSGGPGSTAGSAVVSASALLTAYSQMPHVKRDFRERKVIEVCMEENRVLGYDCEVEIPRWSDHDLLVVLLDRAPAIEGDNQGNFVGGYMNGVRAN